MWETVRRLAPLALHLRSARPPRRFFVSPSLWSECHWGTFEGPLPRHIGGLEHEEPLGLFGVHDVGRWSRTSSSELQRSWMLIRVCVYLVCGVITFSVCGLLPKVGLQGRPSGGPRTTLSCAEKKATKPQRERTPLGGKRFAKTAGHGPNCAANAASATLQSSSGQVALSWADMGKEVSSVQEEDWLDDGWGRAPMKAGDAEQDKYTRKFMEEV